MPKVDRSDIFSGIMAKAWARLGVWERLSMVHSVFGFISLWIVPDLLLDKIGMGKNKTPNSTPKQVAKNIWQIEYWGYVNATVIKGKDGTLLLHSAPVLQQRTVEELAKLGPVGAIVIPNLARISLKYFSLIDLTKFCFGCCEYLWPAHERRRVCSRCNTNEIVQMHEKSCPY